MYTAIHAYIYIYILLGLGEELQYDSSPTFLPRPSRPRPLNNVQTATEYSTYAYVLMIQCHARFDNHL